MAADISHESVDGMIEQLWKCEYIKESHVKALCIKAREILVVWNCRRGTCLTLSSTAGRGLGLVGDRPVFSD